MGERVIRVVRRRVIPLAGLSTANMPSHLFLARDLVSGLLASGKTPDDAVSKLNRRINAAEYRQGAADAR